jgi:hypothetical protein
MLLLMFGSMLRAQENCEVYDEGACALGKALKCHSNLECLSLASRIFVTLFRLLVVLTRGLQYASYYGGDAGISALGDALKSNSSLLRLYLVRFFQFSDGFRCFRSLV